MPLIQRTKKCYLRIKTVDQFFQVPELSYVPDFLIGIITKVNACFRTFILGIVIFL